MDARKRIISLGLLALTSLTLTSCGTRQKLLFLNWGEYIDDSLVEEFENIYNVDVITDLADSNEIFYSKIKSGTTVYDVVCPSDYMVEKLYEADLLSEIDFNKMPLSGYTPDSDDLRYGVSEIMDLMENNTKKYQEEHDKKSIKNYFVPYLWGTWCIAYNSTKDGLYEAVTMQENQWASLFDRSVLPEGTTVAMYDSHQHAYYATMRYLYNAGYKFQTEGVNAENVVSTELGVSDLNKVIETIKNMHFNAWGTDNIKKEIVADNLSLGFMWTGDALYYYAEIIADMVSEAYENGDIKLSDVATMIDTLTDQTVPSPDRTYVSKSNTEYNISFDMYIPDDTIAFMDNLIITKDAANYDLAMKFIDFMTSNNVEKKAEDGEEPEILEPSFANTYYVDYDAVFNSVYDELVDLSSTEFETDEGLYDLIYDYAIGIAFNNYYSRDELKGSILNNFSRAYIKTINKTFNNARV